MSTKCVRRLRTDLNDRPLLAQIIRFILPLMATNLIQQFYHSSDMMIVGLSSEPDALGAIGSSTSFLALVTNIFIGFSVGANVLVARSIGTKDNEKTSRAVHTSICMSLLFGILGAIIGIIFTGPALVAMGLEGRLLALSKLYCYIFLACIPFSALTNFLAAILHAKGDSKTPLYVLSITGILNVLLNLFFVLVAKMSVEGVALATAIANLASAMILWIYLSKKGGVCATSFRKLRIHKTEFKEIATIGFPAGIQSSLFSISNILITSSILKVNSLLTPPGSSYEPVVKGNSASGSIESFVFQAINASGSAASVFVAQSLGSGDYRRARRSFAYICAVSVAVSVFTSALAILLRNPLLALYGVQSSTEVVGSLAYDSAIAKVFWKWPMFFIYGLMSVAAGTLRGFGKSSTSALISFFGTCVFRVVWIYTVFAYFVNLEVIYVSYPVSWLLTLVFFLVVIFRLFKSHPESKKEEPQAENS